MVENSASNKFNFLVKINAHKLRILCHQQLWNQRVTSEKYQRYSAAHQFVKATTATRSQPGNSLTPATAASAVRPEAQPAGGCWLQRSQPWRSPPGRLRRPTFALKVKQFKDKSVANKYRLTAPSPGQNIDSICLSSCQTSLSQRCQLFRILLPNLFVLSGTPLVPYIDPTSNH